MHVYGTSVIVTVCCVAAIVEDSLGYSLVVLEVFMCKGCNGCCVFCLYCDAWSCWCSCILSFLPFHHLNQPL